MKNLRYFTYTLAIALMILSCQQELKIPEGDPCPSNDPTVLCPNAPVEDCPAGATKGSIDVSKFVAIGNSFVAGVQGGALFNAGQSNSLAAIINKQLECVGAPATFNQPDIKATLGWNLFVTQPFLANNTKPILGRMLLQNGTTPDCTTGKVSPKPTPQPYAPGVLEALPNPAFNPSFIYGDGSTKAALNNFSVPAILLGQTLIPQTGAWSGAGVDPRFSPFYGRFAYPGTGTSTIIGDAAAAGGSFFLFWYGLDDFFLYAAFGADPSKAPLTPASGGLPSGFDGQYAAAVGSLLASNANLKGVVANYPDIFLMPHFTSVTYNPIPLDAATVTALTSGFGGFNGVLDAIIANPTLMSNFGLNAADLTARKVTFTASCNNRILLNDETLTDLGPTFDYLRSIGAIDSDAKRAALVPYQKSRQSTVMDVFPLTTGSILGTPGTFGVLGVSEPVGDQYVIIPTEKAEITAARNAYNAVVSATAAAYPTRLALADINKTLGDFVAARAYVLNGVTITPNINPPTGIYSEDGVHPNTRGYAFLAGAIIDAINTQFGATIPKPNIGKYPATGLPINP